MNKDILAKIIVYINILCILVILVIPFHFLSAQSTSTYTYLAPLSGDTTFNPATTNALSTYVNLMIRIFISIAAVLAMIMIVMGGIEYMTSDIVSSKEQGKKRISNALIGLVLALSAYLLLFTINPNLLKTIDVNDESQLPKTNIGQATPLSNSINTFGGTGNCTANGTTIIRTQADCALVSGSWTASNSGICTNTSGALIPATSASLCTAAGGVWK